MTDGDAEASGIGQIDGSFNTRLGPHRVPRIECKKCGTTHHYDARGGRCRDCFAFLREATDEEHEKFTDFLVWKSLHRDTEGKP